MHQNCKGTNGFFISNTSICVKQHGFCCFPFESCADACRTQDGVSVVKADIYHGNPAVRMDYIAVLEERSQSRWAPIEAFLCCELGIIKAVKGRVG